MFERTTDLCKAAGVEALDLTGNYSLAFGASFHTGTPMAGTGSDDSQWQAVRDGKRPFVPWLRHNQSSKMRL